MAIMRHRRVREHRAAAQPATREQQLKLALARKELNVKLQQIGLEMRKVEKANEAIENLKAEVQEMMTALRIESAEFEEISAKFVEEWTQARREVDAHKLYNKLNERDFLSVVKVQMGALATVLSENEIDKLCTTTPKTRKGTKFVVERTKAAAGKKKK